MMTPYRARLTGLEEFRTEAGRCRDESVAERPDKMSRRQYHHQPRSRRRWASAVALIMAIGGLSGLVGGAGMAQQGEGELALLGQVHWPDHDLSQAQLRVFRDAARRDLVAAFPAVDDSGQVLLTLPPGTYYLMAVVDLDGDGKMGPGDGMGFYGVTDPHTAQPAPFEVKEHTFEVTVVVSLMLNEGGQLIPTGVSAPAPPQPPRTLTVSGQVQGLEVENGGFVLLVPLTPGQRCQAAPVSPRQPDFRLTEVAAGQYFVFVVEDTNGDENLGSGDRAGVMGYEAEAGEEFPVIELADDRDDLQLELCWQIVGDGRLQALAGEGLGPRVVLGTFPAVIFGQLPEADETPRTLVTASSDPHFSRISSHSATPGGRYVLALPQGLYFVSICQDRDDDGQPSPGDRLGFYGVSDLTRTHGPQPVYLRPGEIRPVEIPLVARLDDNMQPCPLPVTLVK